MGKYIAFLWAAVFITLCFPLRAGALSADEIMSEAALLMDAETGQVLFEKNPRKTMYPASTTKIMTGLLLTELCDITGVATVSKSALEIDEWDSANIALIQDEKLRVDDLLYGMMLPSANDAANVLAEYAAGSQAAFAQLMTQRAAAIGAKNTRFANAHGLHDGNHYTTAYDLALITREAIKNVGFMRYFSAPSHVIPPTNLSPNERSLTNYHYMLVPDSAFYDPRVSGGKIGYTHEARHTMSTVKVQDGRTLIAVVLSAPDRDSKFYDTEKLFNFGLYEFIELVIPSAKIPNPEVELPGKKSGVGPVTLKAESDFKALLHKSVNPDSVEISHSHKKPLEAGKDIEIYADFSARSENPAVPRFLGSLKLSEEYSLYIRENPAPEYFHGMIPPAVSQSRWFIPLMILSAFVFVVTALLIASRISAHLRLKRRRERLEKIRKSREAYLATLPSTRGTGRK